MFSSDHLARSSTSSLRLLVAAASLTTATLGCAGAPIRVEPFKPGGTAPAEGAVYFLPRKLLQASFTLRFTASVDPSCDTNATVCQYKIKEVSVETGTLSSTAIPDRATGYLIKTQGTFATKTEFSAEMNELGELVSASADQKSSAADWAAYGVELVARVAKVMAMAGPGEVAARQSKVKRFNNLKTTLIVLDAQLKEATDAAVAPPGKGGAASPPAPAGKGGAVTPALAPAPAPAPVNFVEKAEKIQKLRESVLKELDALDKELTTTIDVPISCLVDPSPAATTFALNSEARECPNYGRLIATLNAQKIDTTIIAPQLPKLTLTLVPSDGSALGAAVPAPTEVAAGFYYRIPQRMRVDLLKEDRSVIAREHMGFPQFGGFGLMAVDQDDLRPDKHLKVELHPGLGSVKKVESTATPLSVDTAKKVSDAALSVVTTVKDADLTKLEEDTKRLEAQKKYLDAKKELEKARAEAQ